MMTIECANCGGRGTLVWDGKTSQCPICQGSGRLSDVYRFRLINDETGAESQAVFQAAKAMARVASNGRFVEARGVFERACTEIGVSERTHFLYVDNTPMEFSWCDDFVLPDNQTPESAMAVHFSWYWRGKSPDEVIELRFTRRAPTEDLLEQLWQKVAPRGFTYALAVWEGNIATGERGWYVALTSPDGRRDYASLALAYELAVALREALDGVDAVLARTVP